MKPKSVFILAEREIHMMGEDNSGACVCWNMKNEVKTVKDDQGNTYTASVRVRSGKPYIDFATISEADGDAWEDEDSPVHGGINLEFAKELAVELNAAIEYLEEIMKSGG